MDKKGIYLCGNMYFYLHFYGNWAMDEKVVSFFEENGSVIFMGKEFKLSYSLDQRFPNHTPQCL